jgi:hypothetical protein
MNPNHYGFVFAGGLFLGMLVLLETGRRMGVRSLARDPEGARLGLQQAGKTTPGSVLQMKPFGLVELRDAFARAKPVVLELWLASSQPHLDGGSGAIGKPPHWDDARGFCFGTIANQALPSAWVARAR